MKEVHVNPDDVISSAVLLIVGEHANIGVSNATTGLVCGIAWYVSHLYFRSLLLYILAQKRIFPAILLSRSSLSLYTPGLLSRHLYHDNSLSLVSRSLRPTNVLICKPRVLTYQRASLASLNDFAEKRSRFGAFHALCRIYPLSVSQCA
jgi:hypothetical protein